MLLGFVVFVGIFEFLGLGLGAKIILALLCDAAVWAFALRREIRMAYYAVSARRRREAELRARAAAKREKRENVRPRCASAVSCYYF